MGKWLNWTIWGALHGLLNAFILFVSVAFVAGILAGGLTGVVDYLSQLTGVPSASITGVGVAAAVLVAIVAVGYNVITWLLVGLVSSLTSPILRKLPVLKTEPFLVFVPWLLYTIAIALLFGGLNLITLIIGGVISFISISIWVWIYKALKLQRFLPY